MSEHELSNGLYVPAELVKKKYGLIYEPKPKRIKPSDMRQERNERIDMFPVWGRSWMG